MSILKRPYRLGGVIMMLIMMLGGARHVHAQLSVIGRTFELQNSNGTNSIQLIAPTVSASYTLSMPSAQGAAGTILTNDGSGALTWGALSSSVWSLTGNNISSSSGALGAAPSGSFLGTTGAYDLRLTTNNVVRMIISSTGAVSTQNDLTVNGITVGKGSGSVASNVAIGTSALTNNLVSGGGSFATAVGYQSLLNNTEGTDLTAVGARSLESNTTGTNNTAVGSSALRTNTSGIRNVALGSAALLNLETGSNNTSIGQSSGRMLTTGSGNVFLGYLAGYNETGDSKLYIANASNVAGTLVYGSFANRTMVINPETPVYPSTSPPDPSGALQVNAPTSSTKGFIIKGASSQSVNLVEVQNSSAAALVTINASGNLLLEPIGASAGNTNELRFEELDANGSNYIALKSPDALTSNVTLTLPTEAGSSGQVLTTNGSGTLSWSTALTSSTGWALAGNTTTDSTAAFLGTTDGRPIVFKTNGSERMRVFGTGQVGIGTATPTKTLDVSGTIGASGLVTAAAGVNLNGTTSPLQLNGSAGSNGQVLTSKGSESTPEWKDASVAFGVKAKGRSNEMVAQSSFNVTVTDLDGNDVIMVTLEGDASANVDYYISRSLIGTKQFTVYFGTAFTGRVNYIVME